MGRGNEMLQHPMGGAGWMLECCQRRPVHPKTPSLWRPELTSGWSVQDMFLCWRMFVCVSVCSVMPQLAYTYGPYLDHFLLSQRSYSSDNVHLWPCHFTSHVGHIHILIDIACKDLKQPLHLSGYVLMFQCWLLYQGLIVSVLVVENMFSVLIIIYLFVC